MKCRYCMRKAEKKVWIMDMGITADVCHFHFREYWLSRGIVVPIPFFEDIVIRLRKWMSKPTESNQEMME